MPVDKFGRMSDLKTKDTGVSLTYINNNYVRSDGDTPLSGSLDMRGNTLYNVADPVNPQDVVTKVYVDNTKGSGVIGRKVGDAVSIKENLDFLGKQKIKNLPDPVNDHDAATKEYVDEKDAVTKKYVDEKDAVTKEYVDEKDAVTKKYVDDKTKNLFIDENDNIAFGLNVDMEGNQILGIPEPVQDHEPATKKYVDDLQNQYIDKRGNIKFGRNINLDNKRIFALKDPKKDYEATNKKYVDDTINKRLQEEKDTFLPQDPATKEYVDEAIKGLAGGDLLVSKEGVFIKANGHYRATAPLDIDNHKMENLPDPVDDKDAVNKKYIDGIVENLTLKQGLIRENGGFNLVDSYINMNFHNIRNVGLPKDESDAVPRRFVDEMVKTTLGQVQNQFKQLNQLVSVSASCHKHLKYGDYPFTFGGPILDKKKNNLDRFNGFMVPVDGVIKHVSIYSMGLVLNTPLNTSIIDFLEGTGPNSIYKLYGNKDNPIKIFSLVKVGNFGIVENDEIIGSVFLNISDEKTEKILENEKYRYMGTPNFEFRPNQKYLNEEKNFICPVIQGDIINIVSEYTEEIIPEDESYIDEKGNLKAFPFPFFKFNPSIINKFFLHLATLTFLFKEMSFPDISDLDPL